MNGHDDTMMGVMEKQEARLASIGDLDHAVCSLKHLIVQLEAIRRDTEPFMIVDAGKFRLPPEVVRFQARKELVETERHIRESIAEIFGPHSPEFRKHRYLRINRGGQTGIAAASRVLRDLLFRLEQQRLQLLAREGQSEHVPDIDPLTDLYTRRLLTRYFAHELDRSKRHGYTVALLYLTLPEWQEMTALYGSMMWDEVVVNLACACKAALRGHDYASRLSEHELALLLPQTETQGMHILIRRIAEQFHCAVKRAVPDLSVRLEFGTATFPYDGETLANLFTTATTHRMCLTDDLSEVRILSQAWLG